MSIEKLRLLKEIPVSPSPPLSSQAPLCLSFLDSIWLTAAQVERLFFYDFTHPTSHFMDSHLHNFISSLSLTLRHFYPLAGAIRLSPASDGQFEIIYSEGDSVTVTVAEFTGVDFRDISSHRPQKFNRLRQLVPKPPKSSSVEKVPLLSVQVTLFPSQGLCVAFAVDHATCDGTASTRFIRSWATACRSTEGAAEVAPPVLDRSAITVHHSLQQRMSEGAEYFAEQRKKPTVKSFSDNLVYGTFTLGKDQILRLKKEVQVKAAEEGTALLHLSSFVVTCAYVLNCLVKARRYSDDRNIFFSCAVDWRSRMRPPVSIDYFGNCLGGCMSEALNVGNIAGNDGFQAAAMEIGKNLAGLQGKEIGEVFEGLISKYSEMEKMRALSLTIAGSPKLGVYGIDFGWGRPVDVKVASIGVTEAMAVAESKQDEGGVEIGLVLPEEEMKGFVMYFETGLY